MSKLTFTARRVVQNDKWFFETAVPAADLLDGDIFQVDRWNNTSQRGYQREINDPHSRRIAQFLKGKVESTNAMPVPIVANVRGKLSAQMVEDGIYLIELNSLEPAYIIDGQHRVEAIRKVEADSEATLDNYEMGLVITNFSLEEEMIQFKNLNATANRPAKGLSQVIGHQLAEMTGQAPVTFVEQCTNAAVALTIRLATDPNSPLNGKIAIGGLRKRSFHTTVQASVVSALLPLFLNGRFSGANLPPEKTYEYVLDFWKAVETTWPEAMANPESFTIMRTIGIAPLTRVLNKVFNNLNLNPTRADFENILGDIRAMGVDDAAWGVGQRAFLNGLRAGYSYNKGNTIIADYLWNGVNTRAHSEV